MDVWISGTRHLKVDILKKNIHLFHILYLSCYGKGKANHLKIETTSRCEKIHHTPCDRWCCGALPSYECLASHIKWRNWSWVSCFWQIHDALLSFRRRSSSKRSGICYFLICIWSLFYCNQSFPFSASKYFTHSAYASSLYYHRRPPSAFFFQTEFRGQLLDVWFEPFQVFSQQ